MHEEKILPEGLPSLSAIWWGVVLDTETFTFTIPEEKLEKAKFILFVELWDWGNRRIPRKEAASFGGNGRYWELGCAAVR